MLKNKIIVKKIRNIFILFMALIIMLGAYSNIRRSRAEKVIEISMEVADKSQALSTQTVTANATEVSDGIYLLNLPTSVNENIVTKYYTLTGEEIPVQYDGDVVTLELTQEEVVNQKIQIETEYDKKLEQTTTLYNKELKYNDEVIVTGYMPLNSELEISEIDLATLTNVKLPNEEQTMQKAYDITVFELVEVQSIETQQESDNTVVTETEEPIEGATEVTENPEEQEVETTVERVEYNPTTYEEVLGVKIKAQQQSNIITTVYELSNENQLTEMASAQGNEIAQFETENLSKYVVATETIEIAEDQTQQNVQIQDEGQTGNSSNGSLTINQITNSQWSVVSSDTDVINGKATIVVKGPEDILTAECIKVIVNGQEVTEGISKTMSQPEAVSDGVQYTITVSGIPQDAYQVKLGLVEPEDEEGTLTTEEETGDDSAQAVLLATTYNTLMSVSNETTGSSAFFGNDYIIRSNIDSIEFVSSLVDAPQVDGEICWDVSAAQDESILAWHDGMEPCTVYIGSDNEIFANQDSSYLFCYVGYSSICTSTETIKNINLLNVSNVTNMSYMFYNTGYQKMISLNLGEEFDTSNVTNMSYMFSYCGAMKMHTLNLGDKFNTSNVENMRYMFSGCGFAKMISLNLGRHFDTNSATNMEGMFRSCGMTSMTNLNLGPAFTKIAATNSGFVTSTGSAGAGCIIYAPEEIYQDANTFKLNSTSTTTISYTNGTINPIRSGTLKATTSETGSSSTFLGISGITRQYIDNVTFLDSLTNAPDDAIDVSVEQNGSIMAWYENSTTATGTYIVYIASNGIIYANEDSSNLFRYIGYNSACTGTEKITNIELLNTSKVTNMSYMFQNFGTYGMTRLDLGDNFNTSNVDNMKYMFQYCGRYAMTELELGNNFDTSSVTNMDRMFYFTGYSEMSNLYLGDKFDTSKVTTMSYMFYNCGYSAMTSLDLGPAFKNIASTRSSMFTYTGKSGECVIYTTGAIYSNKNAFKLNKSSTTTISYTRGSINPKYSKLISVGSEQYSSSGFLGNTNIQRQYIQSVTFLSSTSHSTRASAVEEWNVSGDKNGSVIAWYTGSSPYDVYIASDDGIYANENSAGLFTYIGYDSVCTATEVVNNLTNLDTSITTDMSRMFYYTGRQKMTTLDLGDNFDTSNVTNMYYMFAQCGRYSMTSLKLGNKFHTSNVTSMSYMFYYTGNSAMTSLDLGPAFTKIADTRTSFITSTGKSSSCTIYVPESIYYDSTNLKQNGDATTSIVNYTRGKIVLEYQPELQKENVQIDETNKTLTATIKGTTDTSKYISDVSYMTSNIGVSGVYINGEQADGDITTTLSGPTTTTNEITGAQEVTYTLTINNIEITDEIYAVKVALQNVLVTDEYGNKNTSQDVTLYSLNMLMPTIGEMKTGSSASSAIFLGNENLLRQNIENVTFVDSLEDAPEIDGDICWDVSAAEDNSILAWRTETAPYTVYIGSNETIYANIDSTYLFAMLGYSSTCTATEVITNIELLDTSKVTNMTYMFAYCGYTAMDRLDLENNFDTSNVTDMTNMFMSCGNTAMISLDLGDNFDTSNVTNMSGMFQGCGYTAMTSLNLGDEFNTSNVTNMNGMFGYCGYTAMTSLDLGDNFDTSNVTDMGSIFYYCGYSNMTSLDLGPAFIKITENALINLAGKSGECIVYVPESIYDSVMSLKLNANSTTIIDYTRGLRIELKYQPKWTLGTPTINTTNKTIQVTLKGTTDTSKYTTDVPSSTLTADGIAVYIDGEEAEITKTLSEPTISTNGATEVEEVTHTLTLSNFEYPGIFNGKTFKEWSGNVALEIGGATVADKFGNTNKEAIQLSNTAVNQNTVGAMFLDVVAPDVIYKYSESDISKENKTVQIVFDVTDKYYSSGILTKNDLTILIDGESTIKDSDGDGTPDKETITKDLTYRELTALVNGSTKTIGHRYTLTLSGLEQTKKESGDPYLDYSGVVTVAIAGGKVSDTSGNTNIGKTITMGIDLPEYNVEETIPYLPTGYSYVEGTDLDTGLVIQDGSGNQYVWVEVPRTHTVYPTAGLKITEFTDSEYTKIENDLHQYTSVYRDGTTNIDQYSSQEATGLTEIQYNTTKKTMLKSIYLNGGFYVGRYETGISYTQSHRTSNTSPSQTPVIQANAYPYNYVTSSQAQGLATTLATEGYTSSLMFGVQWDLVMKYLEESGSATQDELKKDSKSWGNYYSTTYNIENTGPKYSTNQGSSYSDSPYEKTTSGEVLLTTGASDIFSKQKIYGLAGNLCEYTLEYTPTYRTYCC